jgi:hypothetical protein
MARIPLPQLAHELVRRGLADKPPPYRKSYLAALDAKIPAEVDENGRWSVADRDLPHIAAILRAEMAA